MNDDPNRWEFDFDSAAPGGRGGASVLLMPSLGRASIDGVHRNSLLPRGSTGRLLAVGLAAVGMPRPAEIEAYHVDDDAAAALAGGGIGEDTTIGRMLAATATALSGVVFAWEPVPDGTIWHLRVHVTYS